jgi:CHAT domain-containing protein
VRCNVPTKAAPRVKWEPHELAARLPGLSRTTVISYALLPDGLSTWVYDDRGVFEHWTAGKRRDVESRAQRLRRLCSDPSSDVSDLRQLSRELYDLLIAPVEQHLSADRLLAIEADDGLNGLPFEALLDANNRYFGDRTTIVYSPGIYYRPDERRAARITSATPALVAAVPFSAAPEAVSLTPLADAMPEGEMVAQSFDSAQLIAGGQATTDAMVPRLENASIFHFAGHAVSSTQHSGLLLSDALLDSASLRKASLARVQLAVFSACDTQDGSSGRVYDGDSLVRVFLRARVPHVVASRWNVDSAATRQFMSLFYRALVQGHTVADSIHRAQTGLRSAAGMAHPYYWSAFTAFELI